jgi:hypothetical protein
MHPTWDWRYDGVTVREEYPLPAFIAVIRACHGMCGCHVAVDPLLSHSRYQRAD